MARLAIDLHGITRHELYGCHSGHTGYQGRTFGELARTPALYKMLLCNRLNRETGGCTKYEDNIILPSC